MHDKLHAVKLLIWPAIVLLLGCAAPRQINLQPMYGGVEKLPNEIDADKEFIQGVVKFCGSRDSAAKLLAPRAWHYYYKKDFNTAMKRFNQVWLLDSTNYNSYWGFALLYEAKHHSTDTIIQFLELAHNYAPKVPRLTLSMVQSYIYECRDIKINSSENKIAKIYRSINLSDSIKDTISNEPELYKAWSQACLLINDKKCAHEKIDILEKLGIPSDNISEYHKAINTY